MTRSHGGGSFDDGAKYLTGERFRRWRWVLFRVVADLARGNKVPNGGKGFVDGAGYYLGYSRIAWSHGGKASSLALGTT